jgi:hypothetical protein
MANAYFYWGFCTTIMFRFKGTTMKTKTFCCCLLSVRNFFWANRSTYICVILYAVCLTLCFTLMLIAQFANYFVKRLPADHQSWRKERERQTEKQGKRNLLITVKLISHLPSGYMVYAAAAARRC